MNTFLPYENFRASAECLDNKRLGKQRVEVIQILNALTHGTSWKNHPATRMWKGYIDALVEYGLHICAEWAKRGYIDTCSGKIIDFRSQAIPRWWEGETTAKTKQYSGMLFPKWLGGEIHKSHRANLLRKDPIWYGQFGWKESPILPYYWPV